MPNELEKAAEDLGLTKRQTETIVEAGEKQKLTLKQRGRLLLKGREERRAKLQRGTFGQLLGSAVGGMLVEFNRRSLTGRWTEKINSQALSLVAEGLIINAGARWAGIPFADLIGNSHTTMGAWLLTVGQYGTKDKPDAVRVAIEGTTYAALHPSDKK